MNGDPVNLPVGKAVCVGRNYAAHAQELGNEVPTEPLLFIKPSTALRHLEQPIVLPEGLGAVHHEVEIAVLIGKPLTNASTAEGRDAVAAYGGGRERNLRDVQNHLKAKGQPWERATASDHGGRPSR